MYMETARRGITPQFLSDDARRPDEASEATDVYRHEIVAVPLVARRELPRNG
jgi:hypothetical protein